MNGFSIGSTARSSSRRRDALGRCTTRRTGEQTGAVDLASVDEVDAAVGGRQGGLPEWRVDVAVEAGRDHVPAPRAGRCEPQGDRLAAHRRARQGPVRLARRGRPRPREHRVRLWDPAAAQGWLLRAGRDRASTCTRSASRSASSPASRRSTSRRWCPMWMFANALACGNTFVLKPSEKDPSVHDVHGRAAGQGRAAGRRASTSCRATRSPSTGCSNTPTSRR